MTQSLIIDKCLTTQTIKKDEEIKRSKRLILTGEYIHVK